jgi:hypothetical protein
MCFFSDEELKSLVTILVTRLRSYKKHKDAAHLAEYNLKDYQLAGQCFVDGLFFSEAWALTHRYNMSNWAGKTASHLKKRFNLLICW